MINGQFPKSEQSEERALQRLGANLQLIFKRLMSNQELLRYLHYTDKDPLNLKHPDVKRGDVYPTQIKPIPIVYSESEKSVITVKVLKGVPGERNSEVIDLYIVIEIFVPLTQWLLKSDNMRPYLIMGEIQKTLDNKAIEGLGTLNWSGFQANFFTEEVGAFEMFFALTQFR